MAYTYSKIATYTVGSGGIPSVTFLNIPQNYTDLVVKCSTRRSSTELYGDLVLQFNGNTSAVYSNRRLNGNGSAATSAGNASVSYAETGNSVGATATANTFGSIEIYISNYTLSKDKSFSVDTVGENNGSTAYANLVANVWAQTAAITSISFIPGNSGTILQHSSFHLYGIKAEL